MPRGAGGDDVRVGFIGGLELCRRFHAEAVRPVLAAALPDLRYSAGRLDFGSDLLGYDTPRSTDHDWGPRLQVFLDPSDAHHAPDIMAALAERLPATFLGYPTRFVDHGTLAVGIVDPAGERHGVTVLELDAWLADRLRFDPRAGVTPLDWLSLPTQRLAEVTGGGLFHDDLGVDAIRDRLRWYPDDVWRFVLAALWDRIGEEEHFVGRAGEVGDELGSAIIGGRIARDLMRMCLLLSHRYPPYAKWLGTAFTELPVAATLAPTLNRAVRATDWRQREAHLCRAYETVARLTNATRLAPPLDPHVRGFHNRPFQVLDARRFAAALRAAITDPELRDNPPAGPIDALTDNSGVLADARRSRAIVLGATRAARGQ